METRVFKTSLLKLSIDAVTRTLSLAIVYGILVSVLNVPMVIAAVIVGIIWAGVMVVSLRSAITIRVDDEAITFETKGKTYSFDRDKVRCSAHLSKLGLPSLSVHHEDGVTSFDLSSLSRRVMYDFIDDINAK